MFSKTPIEIFTLASLYSEALIVGTDGTEKSLGACTSFLYERNGEKFLVTNWHVVSGRNNQTLVVIDKEALQPSILRIQLPLIYPLGVHWQQIDIPLYSNEKPVWLEHKILRHKCDIAVIPAQVLTDLIRPLEHFEGQTPDLAYANYQKKSDELITRVGSELFVVGYPFGLAAGFFPIWKRASLASEPSTKIDGLPKFYIDTASKKGMSGSPIYMCSRGTHQFETGMELSGTRYKFVGVYSGRIGVNESEESSAKDPEDIVWRAQLGIGWTAEALIETIDSAAIGEANPKLL